MDLGRIGRSGNQYGLGWLWYRGCHFKRPQLGFTLGRKTSQNEPTHNTNIGEKRFEDHHMSQNEGVGGTEPTGRISPESQTEEK